MSTAQIPVLFLRLEGPLQSWGCQSHHRVRDTALEPTKSGVIGLIACCAGLRRSDPLGNLASPDLKMAVRVDRPGTLWRDYHTVGAKTGCMAANRKIKLTATTGLPETLVSERFYLCDASFLVALTGPEDVLARIERALINPVWPPFLGRKSCPPSTPISAGCGTYENLADALSSCAWRPRQLDIDRAPETLRCVLECPPTDEGASLRNDCPVSFAEPRPMGFRYVRELSVRAPLGEATQNAYRAPQRPRMNYRAVAWKTKRRERGERDKFLCVFCHVPSLVTHHVTYERATKENVETDLRSVCRLCHDAITMLESEREMGLHRIDPLSEEYRELILSKRAQIEAQRILLRDRDGR